MWHQTRNSLPIICPPDQKSSDFQDLPASVGDLFLHLMPRNEVIMNPKSPGVRFVNSWQMWLLNSDLNWTDVTEGIHRGDKIMYPELRGADNVPMFRYLTMRKSSRVPYWKMS